MCRFALKASTVAVFFGILFCTSLQAQPALLGSRSPEQRAEQPFIPSPPIPTPPPVLTLRAGTVITVETSEILSSNTHLLGDSFIAQLHHPLVIQGWVVARGGQTVVGRIAAAKKAGRVKGTSKLTLQLEEIALVDGHQAYVETDAVENSGPTSHKKDITVVAITTGVGAAIGSICGGRGAAIGAAAGTAAGIAGVLLTRGEKVEIGPENLLTFRLSSEVLIPTEKSQFAFWQVAPEDYPEPVRTVSVPLSPTATVISQPLPSKIPVSVWSQIQGIAVGIPRSDCRK